MLPLRILVADDNPLSLRFFADAVATFGLTCVEAVDGLMAVECADAVRCDLLLLDARMPRCDGSEALQRIRAGNGASRDAVALATTAEPGADVRFRLEHAGFADVLHKPLGLAALRNAFERHLPLRRVAEDSAVDAPIAVVLDDPRALEVAGGDRQIVAALRQLLRQELDALPAEMAALQASRSSHLLHERLHRLDASAGFCGVPTLAIASSRLRQATDRDPAWPVAAVADFLDVCAAIRRALDA